MGSSQKLKLIRAFLKFLIFSTHFLVSSTYVVVNFILGLNFIFFCFKLIIRHYHFQKQKELKFKPRLKLNHKTYTELVTLTSFSIAYITEQIRPENLSN